jgi:hypothetical protein
MASMLRRSIERGGLMEDLELYMQQGWILFFLRGNAKRVMLCNTVLDACSQK